MSNNGESIRDKLDSIGDLETKNILVSRSTLGLEQEYSERYGLIGFEVEEISDHIYYTLEFDGETELEFMRRNGRGSDNLIYVLEALSQNVPFGKATEEFYASGTGKQNELNPVITPSKKTQAKISK